MSTEPTQAVNVMNERTTQTTIQRLRAHVHRTPSEQRALISQAVEAANPDIDGDLMRHLDMRGVGDVVREGMEIAGRRGRSKYVQGWRP